MKVRPRQKLVHLRHHGAGPIHHRTIGLVRLEEKGKRAEKGAEAYCPYQGRLPNRCRSPNRDEADQGPPGEPTQPESDGKGLHRRTSAILELVFEEVEFPYVDEHARFILDRDVRESWALYDQRLRVRAWRQCRLLSDVREGDRRRGSRMRFSRRCRGARLRGGWSALWACSSFLQGLGRRQVEPSRSKSR